VAVPRFFSAKCNIYISSLCYDVSVHLSVRLYETMLCGLSMAFVFIDCICALKLGLVMGKASILVPGSCIPVRLYLRS